mmetsp:Transcript_14294/g.32467  ORF Transcript_14294/g.32467 Transcript_14294/m.32467 type:complete len:207 (-) Transcript_14294:163-783(-)
MHHSPLDDGLRQQVHRAQGGHAGAAGGPLRAPPKRRRADHVRGGLLAPDPGLPRGLHQLDVELPPGAVDAGADERGEALDEGVYAELGIRVLALDQGTEHQLRLVGLHTQGRECPLDPRLAKGLVEFIEAHFARAIRVSLHEENLQLSEIPLLRQLAVGLLERLVKGLGEAVQGVPRGALPGTEALRLELVAESELGRRGGNEARR